MSYASCAIGVLLAAGRGTRFDSSGQSNKLLAPLDERGMSVAGAAARRLRSSVPTVLAVVRPGDETLAHALNEAGCDVVFAPDAARGMGASLASAVRATLDAQAWIVALADMPWIEPATISAIARWLDAGASIVVPCYRGVRGHPVGFGAVHGEALAALDGDIGARTLVASASDTVTKLDVDDPGILADVDTPNDLIR